MEAKTQEIIRGPSGQDIGISMFRRRPGDTVIFETRFGKFHRPECQITSARSKRDADGSDWIFTGFFFDDDKRKIRFIAHYNIYGRTGTFKIHNGKN